MTFYANTKLTLASALTRFLTSLDFRSLSANTRRNYERELLERFEPLRDRPLTSIRRGDLKAILEGLEGRPGSAHNFLTAARRFFVYALDNEWIEIMPVVNLKLPPLGSIKRWDEEKIMSFLEGASPVARRAVMLGLYTGQRISDLVKMTWEDIEGDYIRAKQKKTGTELIIPIHATLRKELDGTPEGERAGPLIRYHGGKPWTTDALRIKLDREAVLLGYPSCQLHGLRAACACMLAEEGATVKEIQAIGGWKKSSTVDGYTAGVNQKKLADNAMRRMK